MDAVTSYARMLPIFLMDLPGVTEVLAKQALYLAGRKFCIDSKLYIKELSPINVIASTRSYDLTSLLPSDTKVLNIFEARYGSSATVDTTAPLDKNKYVRTSESTFKLIDTPSEDIANGLVIKVVLRPTVSSTGLETWFYDRYFEAIVAYGRSYLLTFSKTQPWYDPERAKMYLEQYKGYLEEYRFDEFHEELNLTAYNSMLPWLVDEFPGVHERTINQFLAMSGRKFCMDTKLYEYTLSAINVVSGTRTYDLSSLLPTDTKIIDIVEARYGSSASDDTTAPMERIDYLLTDETTFKFTTTPTSSVDGGLVVKVSLRPKANSTSIATWFYDRYFEPILTYTKYLLYGMDNNTIQLSEMHLVKYKEYVSTYIKEDFVVQELDVTSYSSMLPMVIEEFPEIEERTLNNAFAVAGRKFCLDTELYEKELDPIDIVASTQTYDLSSLLPTDTKIIRLDEVRYGTNATTETTEPYNDYYYSLYEEDTFKFRTAPVESITNGLVVKVILRPTVSSTGLATWFYDRYNEAINVYAKYYILNMNNKTWSDPEKAESYKREYRDYLDRYKREKFTKYKNADVFTEHVPARF